MGQLERGNENKRQSRRDKAKAGRSKRAASVGTCDLRTQDWVAIAALIVAFAENGGAVRIGYTRDGGALALGCYLDEDYATEYVRPSEDFTGALIEIAEAWLPESGIGFHQAFQEMGQGGKR